LMIFMSWVSAVMTATDYVETKLKNRYIGKADYLIEFDNIKDKYIMANMKADPIAVKESLTELEQEKPLLKNINGVYRMTDVSLKI